MTDDYDGKKARFEALGFKIAAESSTGKFRVAYVDTAVDFGFYTEVVETYGDVRYTIGTGCSGRV